MFVPGSSYTVLYSSRRKLCMAQQARTIFSTTSGRWLMGDSNTRHLLDTPSNMEENGIENEEDNSSKDDANKDRNEDHVTDRGEEEPTPTNITSPLTRRKRKSPDTQAQVRDMRVLETVNATLRTLTESAAVKCSDNITAYCQYLEHEFRAIQESDPRYFRYVQGQIGQLIYNVPSPHNHQSQYDSPFGFN